MFGALEDYKSKSFYEEHKSIQFDTLTEQGNYEIIADFKAKRTNKATEQKTMRIQDRTKRHVYNGIRRLAGNTRDCKPSRCYCHVSQDRNAPDGGKPADKDQTAGKADDKYNRQKYEKNRQDHSKRDGQGDYRRD